MFRISDVFGCFATPSFVSGVHYHPDEIGKVARAKPLHHPGAMPFHRARRNVEMKRDFLVGKAGYRQIEHFALTSGQRGDPGTDGFAIGQHLAALARIGRSFHRPAQKIGMAPGYSVVFTGETEFMEETFGYMIESLILAVLFVYLILAAQFESFIDPLSIMFSLPLAIVGMAGMLAITGDTINIMSLIGLILLMGLVTKNAILLIDCAKNLRAQGMDRREALITAGRTRFRPIMMTTSAMIAGMLPLAFAVGAGAGMRAPMARAVIGGLLTSTALTLVVVPVMYTLLDDLKRKGAVTARPIKGV